MAVQLTLFPALEAGEFERDQREHERVELAFTNQLATVEALFAERGVTYPPAEIFLRVIKHERVIEVWARSTTDDDFLWMRNFDVCALSGGPGPKRREGDMQVPEGFYAIDLFNPESSYHLSLRVSYPNDSDDILSDPEHPGSDIYIHGSCGSSGCLAIRDEPVEALYVIAVAARDNGQRRIPIHIFPVRFDAENVAWLESETSDPALWDFWNNLRPGYDYFESHRRLPDIDVDDSGRYVIEESP